MGGWIGQFKESELNRICRRFEKLNPGYECYLNPQWSCRGSYDVYVGNKETRIGRHYNFRSQKEFREWVNGVIMEG